MALEQSLPSTDKKPEFVRAGFAEISAHYDRINDWMTFGLHRHWKRTLVRGLRLQPGDRVLDLCCGTGDLAYLGAAETIAGMTVGLDFASEMITVAQSRTGWCVSEHRPVWIRGDALRLPFPNHSFDAAMIGYGLRNLADVRNALGEISRVLRPGGRLAILETGLPRGRLVAALHHCYLRRGIPLLAGLVHGSAEMHRYLASSALAFASPEEIGKDCAAAELNVSEVRQFLFGSSVAMFAVKRP